MMMRSILLFGSDFEVDFDEFCICSILSGNSVLISFFGKTR